MRFRDQLEAETWAQFAAACFTQSRLQPMIGWVCENADRALEAFRVRRAQGTRRKAR